MTLKLDICNLAILLILRWSFQLYQLLFSPCSILNLNYRESRRIGYPDETRSVKTLKQYKERITRAPKTTWHKDAGYTDVNNLRTWRELVAIALVCKTKKHMRLLACKFKLGHLKPTKVGAKRGQTNSGKHTAH